MKPLAYADTSALGKWYVEEPNSRDFSAWIQEQEGACISSLTVTEFRCLLGRKLRSQQLTWPLLNHVYNKFEQDIAEGSLRLYPIEDWHFQKARLLIDSIPDIPLRTLDAIHLSVAKEIPVTVIASADKVMLSAAETLGFECARFD